MVEKKGTDNPSKDSQIWVYSQPLANYEN
jgi:hypothetical protein